MKGWRDRRHWEFRLGRLRAERWCIGAPCHLRGVTDRRHPVRVWVVAARWMQGRPGS